jgi:hypothetical protein
MKNTNGSISLPVEYWEALDKIRNDSGISRSSLIAICIMNFYQLKPNKKGQLVSANKNLKFLILNNLNTKQK